MFNQIIYLLSFCNSLGTLPCFDTTANPSFTDYRTLRSAYAPMRHTVANYLTRFSLPLVDYRVHALRFGISDQFSVNGRECDLDRVIWRNANRDLLHSFLRFDIFDQQQKRQLNFGWNDEVSKYGKNLNIKMTQLMSNSFST